MIEVPRMGGSTKEDRADDTTKRQTMSTDFTATVCSRKGRIVRQQA
jgi:hypothetical protein